MGNRVIRMSVLPGEPLDGTGRVCVHLFVQDEQGPMVEPHVLHPGKNKGELEAIPTRGRLACNRKLLPEPIVTMRTDDPRAVTCPKCLSSDECIKTINLLKTQG